MCLLVVLVLWLNKKKKKTRVTKEAWVVSSEKCAVLLLLLCAAGAFFLPVLKNTPVFLLCLHLFSVYLSFTSFITSVFFPRCVSFYVSVFTCFYIYPLIILDSEQDGTGESYNYPAEHYFPRITKIKFCPCHLTLSRVFVHLSLAPKHRHSPECCVTTTISQF